MPGLSSVEKKDRLSRMSYKDFLLKIVKVDPAVIQTVLNWENKGEGSVNDFIDNSIVDRIIKEGFVDRLYK